MFIGVVYLISYDRAYTRMHWHMIGSVYVDLGVLIGVCVFNDTFNLHLIQYWFTGGVFCGLWHKSRSVIWFA